MASAFSGRKFCLLVRESISFSRSAKPSPVTQEIRSALLFFHSGCSAKSLLFRTRISFPSTVCANCSGDAVVRSTICRRKSAFCSERSVRAIPSRSLQKAEDRKSTRLNSSHVEISYAVFCLKKKKKKRKTEKRKNNSDNLLLS